MTAGPFDDESADAAQDLLRLFAKAKDSIAEARLLRMARHPRAQAAVVEMRHRLAESIMDDCQLFDEATMILLVEFLTAWRTAVYERDFGKQADVDASFERAYRKAVSSLRGHIVVLDEKTA